MEHYEHPLAPDLRSVWAKMGTLHAAEQQASHERESVLLSVPRTPWNKHLTDEKLVQVLYQNNSASSVDVLANYEAKDKLGEGTYGVVFRAAHRITGEIVALKHIRFESTDEGTPSTAIREVALLRILKHHNVVGFLEIAHDEKAMVLVFEFLDQDLHNYIEGTKTGMDHTTICSFLFQLLTGLDYCHKNQILHRDLKPQNLLINFQGELKIADFGLARSGAIPINAFTHEVVTLWYRPPDVILGNNRYGPGIDIWGVGCIFAEMFVSKPIMPGSNPLEQLVRIFRICGGPNNPSNTLWDPTKYSLWSDYEQKILSDPKTRDILFSSPTLRKDFYRQIPGTAMDLLVRFLQYDENERIGCEEALRHPFFAQLSQIENPPAPGTLSYHVQTNYNSIHGSMLPIRSDDQAYNAAYFTLQVLDPLNPNFYTERYYNISFRDGLSLAPLPPELQQDQDLLGAQEQLQFDAESRSFEAQRALGRVAREYALWSGIEEVVVTPQIIKEEGYHHFTFDHLDFQHLYHNSPESYMLQYGNELNGYIETSLLELYENHSIGAVMSEYADYAWKFPTVNSIATGAADHFPINGDEEGLLEQKAYFFEQQEKNEYYLSHNRPIEPQRIEYALTPLQHLMADQAKFTVQVNAEKMFIETNWYYFRSRVASIPTDTRRLLLSLLPTIHQNVALVHYLANESYANLRTLYSIVTEDQFNWLINQATGGLGLSASYTMRNKDHIVMSEINKDSAGIRCQEYKKLARRNYLANHRLEASKLYTNVHGNGLFDPSNMFWLQNEDYFASYIKSQAQQQGGGAQPKVLRQQTMAQQQPGVSSRGTSSQPTPIIQSPSQQSPSSQQRTPGGTKSR